MKPESYDILVMVTPVIFERLKHLYHRIADNLTEGRVFLVGSSEVVRMAQEQGYGERIGTIDENEILPFDDVYACIVDQMAPVLAGRELPRGAAGWYYQQFLKYAYAKRCDSAYYMAWDGDCIPCRRISMFQKDTGTPLLDMKHEYHEEYFETMRLLVPGLEKKEERSFISEHMLFHCETVRELMDEIEANNDLQGNSFWEKIIRAIPADKIQQSAFSEFETYGNYVVTRHPSAYRLREWHSFRLAGEFFDPKEIKNRDFKWLGIDFDAISFEKGLSVKEELKGIFDKPEYQRTMTPREVLEIVQKEYVRNAYKEVWEDSPDADKANRTSGAFKGGSNPYQTASVPAAADTAVDTTIMFFDQYQRYHTAAELIRKIQNRTENRPLSGLSCLEVGANEHRDLGKELPDLEIFYTDLHLPESMKEDDHCFTADATDLKEVADNSYDFCIAMDVFEHIPRGKRRSFITELYRVCKTAVIMSFPYNAPEVVQTEHEVNDMYRDLFGQDHPWLIEHIENGLPDREKTERVLNEEGIRFTSFTHGNVEVWNRMIVLNFFIDEDAFSEVVSNVNLYYNRKVYEKDTGDVDYRVFYVMEKSPDIAGITTNPFAGKHVTNEDIAPINRALELIIT